MFSRRRCATLGLAAAGLLALAGCQGETDTSNSLESSSSSGDGAAAVTSASPSGVYGTSIDPSASDPTDVATDSPVTVAPGDEAVVFVTYLTWIESSAAVEEGSYVQGVVESGGVCTLTLSQGASTVTATAQAEPDATTTSCGGIAIPRDRLSAGDWSAVVSYESPTTRGSSEASEVTVP
jgi:hypothetical protein